MSLAHIPRQHSLHPQRRDQCRIGSVNKAFEGQTVPTQPTKEGRLCICVFWREVVMRVTRGSRGVEELNDPAAVVPLQIRDPRSKGPTSWREVLCVSGCVEQRAEVKGGLMGVQQIIQASCNTHGP